MLPDSIPASVWSEFQAHRRKIKKPMTEYAETLILCKLEKWRIEVGANPVDVLNESIEKGWSGVFLNGHGVIGKAITEQNQCAVCGKPLTSGFKHSSKGRLCHEC